MIRSKTWLRGTWVLLLALALAGCGVDVGQPPAAPTDVTATPGPGYVKLEWAHDGQGVQGFRVYRSGGLSAQQATPHATVDAEARSFLDRDIVLGQGYRYSVEAVGAGGASEAAAQSGADVKVDPGVDLVMGRLTAPGDPVANLAFYLYIDPDRWPQGDATHVATVTGPEAFSHSFELDRAAFERGFHVQGVYASPVAGEYTLELPVAGTTYTAATAYDPTDAFEAPIVAEVTEPTQTGVSVAWGPVPGAASYAIDIYDFEGAYLGVRELTRGPSGRMTGLSLEPGVFFAQVVAYAWDLTALAAGLVPEKPTTANVSRSNLRPFAVAEAGACPDPSAAVSIPDEALRSAVLARLGAAGPDPTCQEMQQLVTLVAPMLGIASLEGLQHATNLYSLSVYGNDITDLSPVAGLTKLLALFASDNPIASLEPVAGLTELQYIEVSNNDVTSLAPLSGLDRLVRVGAAHMPQLSDIGALAGKPIASLWLNGDPSIDDFSAIATLSDLRHLLVGGTAFDDADLAMVSAFPNLERLQLWGDEGISDLSPIVGLPLRELDVGGTSVTDLTPVHGMAGTLEVLYAYALGLDDADIGFLEGFSNLTALWLDYNDLTDLAPLVANAGLGEGDVLKLENNCLDLSTGSTASAQLEALVARGVDVTHEPQRTCMP